MAQLIVVMAQINPLVGDITGNLRIIVEQSQRAVAEHRADIIVFPELVITGYPPEDLLLRASIAARVASALDALCTQLPPAAHVVIGYPRSTPDGLFNVAGVIHGGALLAEYAKIELPNYEVFDEKRYFAAGDRAGVLSINGFCVGLSVCEDVWHPRPTELAVAAGAELLLNINASPFHLNKQEERRRIVEQRAIAGRIAIVYVNQVGGQDELVFDGGSMAIDSHGELQVAAPQFAQGLFPLRVERSADGAVAVLPGSIAPVLSSIETVYAALVMGVRDYVGKNRFKGVVLGLSGGIDSALTLAVAVDALGAERVTAVMMPFRYTAEMSIEDAKMQAQTMNVAFRVISIEPMYEAFMTGLREEFAGRPLDLTEQNIQARCRGVLLMALSNKHGSLVLTTGNKSEMAVGYSTLYGDMAGGFDVLKDVPKTLVFELARHRNSIGPVIPRRVIDRPPSAELAPGQKDQDSLPPYEILDQILERYVEDDLSANAIIAAGFDADIVHQVVRMVDRNEYKRRQAPIGVRISRKAFGRDRRYPVTSGWDPGE